MLGGGGSRDAVQVGMLRALFERGITPDLVVGTSIGAFNGAVLAANPATAIETLDHFWRSSKRGDAFPVRGIKPFLYWRRAQQSFLPADRLSRFDQLRAQRLPAHRGSRPALRRGCDRRRAGDARAVPRREPGERTARQCGNPGIFPPVNPDTLMDLFSYVTEVYARQMVLPDLAELAHIPILYPPSPAPGTMSPLDLEHTDELLESSYQDTKEYLSLKMATT